MSKVVNLASEREARRVNDEDFADVLPRKDGGVTIFAELTRGVDFLWELDQEQAAVLISALTLALHTKQSVKIVQPHLNQMPRTDRRFRSSLVS
jgi:hypothetical protein